MILDIEIINIKEEGLISVMPTLIVNGEVVNLMGSRYYGCLVI